MPVARVQVVVAVGGVGRPVGLEVAVVPVAAVGQRVLRLHHPLLHQPAGVVDLGSGGELRGGRGVGLVHVRRCVGGTVGGDGAVGAAVGFPVFVVHGDGGAEGPVLDVVLPTRPGVQGGLATVGVGGGVLRQYCNIRDVGGGGGFLLVGGLAAV